MKRSAGLIASLIAVAAVVLVAAGQTGSASAAPPKFKFTVVSHDAQGTVTPGDFFATPPVQNAQASVDAPVSRNGATVGLAETIITITRVSGDDVAAMIECSVELPGGIVFFNGSAHFADLGTGATLPVTGGTGQYAGASGVVTLVAAADGSTTDLRFNFSTK